MKRSRHSAYERRKGTVGFLFTVPWLIGSMLFFVLPVIQSFILSITKVDTSGNMTKYEFIGFENYSNALLTDTTFVKDLWGNLGTMVVTVALVLIFSLFIAIILNQKFRGRLIARAIFFLPVIIASGVVINIIKGDIFAQTAIQGQIKGSQFQVEVLQNILMSFRIGTDTINSIMSIINSLFEIAWKCGIQILIFMSGLAAIPPQVKEAASIEGATGWEFFWKISLPMISPIIQINLIYSIIDSFTDYSNSMIQRIYKLTSELNYSYSSTLSWIYFGIIFIITGIVFLIINKKTFYYVD